VPATIKRVGLRPKLTSVALSVSGIAILLALVAPPVLAETGCTLNQVASLPANFKNGDIRIDVTIADQTVKFLLGSGQSLSNVGSALAGRLGLARGDLHALLATAAGTLERDSVVATGFHIGHMEPHTETLLETEGWGDGTGSSPAGLVGQDFFQNYDIELDPAQSVVNLFLPIECTGHAVYWWDDHFELPLDVAPRRAPRTQVVIDGKTFEATIRTEEAHSSIDIAEAKRQLDVPEEIEAPVQRADGSGPVAPNPSFSFKELVFGPITLRNPKLELIRYRALARATRSHIKNAVSTEAPVVIGMDILGKFHSMISYRNSKIFFTLPSERKPAPVGAKP
jgi:hypothetical protein